MKSRSVEILVLDDDQDTLDIVLHILGPQGYRVDTACGAAEGIDKLASRRYHVLVLDLKLPGMDGIEVLRRVREKDRDLAVIVLTGYPSVESAVASLKEGVSDYVEKPIDRDKLLQAVERVVRDKGLLRSPEEALLLSVGAKVRAERKRQELTLKQVARRTGLSVSLLSQIERAESAASVSSLYKIASALGINLRDLFEGY
ncbi:MAG TPA: response regulator [Myxococcota bacterium]|nr:response regulator [Myxococcota bacterium]HRY94316.1 response regulator [Myxococcota bacterium]HSA23315.1 response regulator [Myxococcota bacterium]